MSRFRTVLAVPETELNSPFVGLLRPIFEIHNGETIRCDRHDFPNNGLVFTSAHYQEILDAFPSGTLVRLHVEENQRSSLDPSEPNYAKYIVQPDRYGEPERWAVQLVIDHPFSAHQRTIMMDEAPSHPVWLRDPKTARLYGPFDTTARKLTDGRVAVELQPPDAIPYAPERDPNSVASVSMHTVETEDIDGVEYIAFTRASFARLTITWVDFISDEALVNLVRKVAGTALGISPGQLERLRNFVADTTMADLAFTPERQQRAAALLDRVAGWQEYRQALMEEYLSTDQGEAHLQRFMDARQDEFVDRAFEKNYGLLMERVGEHAQRLTKIAAEIEARESELADLRQVDTEAIQKHRELVEGELETQLSELRAVEEQIGVGREIIDIRAELTELAAERDIVSEEVGNLREETEELQKVAARLREEAQGDLNDLRSRLTSLKPYVDTLTGAATVAAIESEVEAPRITKQPPKNLTALVDMLHEALLAANHRIAKRDVANAFTGIITSPLTILAGLPGVGKTSLVTRLAEVLGMARGSQFLTVRVPRGWHSRQDVLGYHNPITGEYEQAPTGLYPLLKWHQQSAAPVPAWVLFDEANLSAPEHYLSDFLGMMDEVADRTLATGAPNEIFEVPEHLRFVFTINQDHSVESLTPRVLDRAAVIYVPPPDSFDAANPYSAAPRQLDGTLTVEMLDELLAAVQPSLNQSEDVTLKKLVRVMHDDDPKFGVPTRISPRKYRRVLRHTATMRHILGINTGLDALDHAVATHVLPLLRGSGKAYGARLSSLAQEVESLPVSAGLLARIIAAGEATFDEYNFQTLA